MNNEEKILEILSVMQQDMSELKSDVAELKTDVAVLKTDVAVLKVKVTRLEADVAGLKEGQEEVRGSVNRLVEWADECGYVVKFPLPRL